MGTDWMFWFSYGVPLCIGLVGGWWLRGVKAEDDANRIESARRRHPGYAGRDEWARWEWDT